MADSLCGPSNALQNFQKHSTVDRTLQQDRLLSRRTPSQGFRSSPGPNAGFLEPDFQAFQAGNLPLESQNGLLPHSVSYAPPSLQKPGPSAWASDFERMHLSTPPPQFQQQSLNTPVQQRQDEGGWHQDFARQFQNGEQQGMIQPSQMGGASGHQYGPMFGGMGMGMGMQPQFNGGMLGAQAGQSMAELQQQPVEAFDEVAFARAFEDAARSQMDVLQESGQVQEQGTEFGQDILIAESAERLMASDQVLNQERIGADLIYDPTQEPPQERPQYEDPDALAKTAGELLDSVRNNHSEKFQNSQFLQLMRQLRDREVMVKGDNIVGINGEAREGNDGREGIKNEIIYLLHDLKRLALDRDRRLGRNASERVRKSLLILLQLNSLCEKADPDIISSSRIQRTLQALIDSPDLVARPAIRDLGRLTLLNFNTLTTDKPDIPPSPEMEAIHNANAEIMLILAPSDTAFETLIYNYISDSLQHSSGAVNQDPLSALLGYRFTQRLGNIPLATSTDSPHIQRAREIMGRAISDVMTLCEGFWCPELPVEKFFALVSAYELYGGVKSREFKSLFNEVELDVQETLREISGRVKDLAPATEEDRLPALDALRRLRFIEVHRKQREADEGSGGRGTRIQDGRAQRHANLVVGQ